MGCGKLNFVQRNPTEKAMKKIGFYFVVLVFVASCSKAQTSRNQETVALFNAILENFSGNPTKSIAEQTKKLDKDLILKTERFEKKSNGFEVGFDSILHIFKPSPDSVDDLTLSFLNENYTEKNTFALVQWSLHCSYKLENGEPNFTSESAYQLTLPDIQTILGKYEKERIPREASSKCSFHYENPKTNKKAIVVVDCFLPCDAKGGNTINSITITFQK